MKLLLKLLNAKTTMRNKNLKLRLKSETKTKNYIVCNKEKKHSNLSSKEEILNLKNKN